MAQHTSLTLNGALATIYENKVAGLINRACPTLQFIRKIPGKAKNVTWDLVYGAADAAATVALAEDGDITTINSDSLATAYLPYCVYHDATGFTGLGEAIARAAGNPEDLKNVEVFQMDRSSLRLGAGIANHLFAGNSGATPKQINGLITATTGALRSTGTYATVDKASITQFAGNQIDLATETGGALTLAVMRKMISTICSRDEMSRAPTVISASNLMFDKYCGLFDAQRRWTQDVTLGNGRKVTLDGGAYVAEFDGIPIVRDVKIPESSTGTMLFLNDEEVRMYYLPMPTAKDIAMGNITVTEDGKKLSRGTGLTGKIIKLGKKGDYDTYAIICYIALQVRQPNSCGYMFGASLT